MIKNKAFFNTQVLQHQWNIYWQLFNFLWYNSKMKYIISKLNKSNNLIEQSTIKRLRN